MGKGEVGAKKKGKKSLSFYLSSFLVSCSSELELSTAARNEAKSSFALASKRGDEEEEEEDPTSPPPPQGFSFSKRRPRRD